MAFSSCVGTEAILLSTELKHDGGEENVDEIKLELPCTITQIVIADARSSTENAKPALLRAYAKDLNNTASRFASLCSNALACMPSGTSTFQTEVVLTDHVVVRGSYSHIQISLLGYPDNDGAEATAQRAAALPTDEAGDPLPPVQGGVQLKELGLEQLGAGGTEVSGPGAPCAAPGNVLPMASHPPLIARAINIAIDYFLEVLRSRSNIEHNPPHDRLLPLMSCANMVCAALQGKTKPLAQALSEARPDDPPPSVWLQPAVDMAVSWCSLAASPMLYLPGELTVGTAGLAAALVLCATPVTCTAFIEAGGMHSVAEVLQSGNTPADIVRLTACIFELLQMTAGAAGCDMLLGWWVPPPPRLRPPPPPPPAPKTEPAVVEEAEGRGGAGVKVEKGGDDREAEVQAAGAGGEEDGKRPQQRRLQKEKQGGDGDEIKTEPDGLGGDGMGIQRQEQGGDEAGRGQGGEGGAGEGEVGAGEGEGEGGAGGQQGQEGEEGDEYGEGMGGYPEGDEDAPYPEGEEGGGEGGGEGEEVEGDDGQQLQAEGGEGEEDDGRITDPDHPLYGMDQDLYESEPSDGGAEEGEPGQEGGDTAAEARGAAGDEAGAGGDAAAPSSPPSSKQQPSGAAHAHKGSAHAGAPPRTPAAAAPSSSEATTCAGTDSAQPKSLPSELKQEHKEDGRPHKRSRPRSRSRSGSRRSRSRSRSKSRRSRSRSPATRGGGRSRSRSRSRSRRERPASRDRRSERDSDKGRDRDRDRGKRARREQEGDEGKGDAKDAAQPQPAPPRRREGEMRVAPLRSSYPLLVRLLASRPHPAAVGAMLARVLRRLHAYDLMTRFQRSTDTLLKVVTGDLKGSTTGNATHAKTQRGTDANGASPDAGPEAPAQGGSAAEAIRCLREAAGQLAELSDLVLLPRHSDATSGNPPPGGSDLNNLLPTPPSVDPVILTAMAPRAFFPSLPALVSAGFAAISAAKAAAQAPRKERDRGADSASASQARAVAQQQLNQLVQVQAQLVSGLRLLVAALVSSPAGLQVMQTNRADIAGLAYALDPQAEADPQSEAGIAPDPNSAFSRSPAGLAAVAAAAAASAAAAAKPLPALHGGERKPQLAPALAAQPKPAAELAAVLRQALASLEAVTILDAGPAPGTPQSQAAVNTLAAAVAGGHGCEGARIAALRSLTLSRGALPTLLRLMRERGRVHRAAVTSSADGGGMHDGQAQFGMMGQASMGLDDLDWDNDYSFAGLPRPSAVKYAPESLYADTIVLELVRELCPEVLRAWAPAAAAIADAGRAEMEGLAAAASVAAAGGGSSALPLGGAVGDDRSRRALKELLGRAEVVALAQDRGLYALLEVLDNNLARLVARGSEHAAAASAGLSLVPPVVPKDSISQAASAVLGSTVGQEDIDVRGVMALMRSHDRVAAVDVALSLMGLMLKAAQADIEEAQGALQAAASDKGKDKEGAGAAATKRLPEVAAEAAASDTARVAARQQLVLQVYSADGLALMQRALRTAAAALAASSADAAWCASAGEALDLMDRLRNQRSVASLATAAAHAAAGLLGALHAAGVPVNKPGLLDSALKLHAQLCVTPDSFAACLGSRHAPTDLLRARAVLAGALCVWVDAGWQPQLVHAVLGVSTKRRGLDLDLERGLTDPAASGVGGSVSEGGAGGAGSGPKLPAAQALTPSEVYTAACVLGDIMPPEWPSQAAAGSSAGAAGRGGARGGVGGSEGGASAPPPPAFPARRAALLSQIVGCDSALRRLLAYGAACESRLVRCAVVRLCARTAGLGPSMGTFCAQPLVEPLAVAAKTVGAGGAPMGEGIRRVLEVMVPLTAKPALKAGLLELRTAGVLAHIIHRLIGRLSEEGPEGQAALTMALEALLVLLNPEVALNAAAPRDRRIAEDIPPLADCTQVVVALLAALQHLGRDAHMVRALLVTAPAGLATHATGRQALRQGVIKWHWSTTGVPGTGTVASAAHDPEQVKAAMRWAATRLVEVGERCKLMHAGVSGPDAAAAAGPNGVGAVASDVAHMLQKLGDSAGRGDEGLASDPAAQAAPQHAAARYAAVMEAALEAAAGKAGGLQTLASTSAADALPPLVNEPTMISFWRYVRARGIRTLAVLPAKKAVKWEVGCGPVDSSAPSAAPSASAAHMRTTAAKMLPEGLTRPKHPRPGRSAAAAAATGIPGGPGGKGRDDSHDVGSGSGAPPTASSAAASGMPDIPTVMAPRRGGPPRRTGAGSNRPPSMHVDDYQRQQKPGGGGGGGAAAAPSGSAPAQNTAMRPPPQPTQTPTQTPPQMRAPMGGGGGMPESPAAMSGGAGGRQGPMGGMGGPPRPPPVQNLDNINLYDDLFTSPTPRAQQVGHVVGGGMLPPQGSGQLPGPPSLRQQASGPAPVDVFNIAPVMTAAPAPAPARKPKPAKQQPQQPKPQALPPPPPLPPPQQPHQAQGYLAPFEAHGGDNLYDDIYADVGGAAPAQQQQQQQLPPPPAPPPQGQQGQGRAGAGAGAAGPGGGGGPHMSQQQILALLQDPVRMAALLRSNPGLASMLRAYLPPGFKLPGL